MYVVCIWFCIIDNFSNIKYDIFLDLTQQHKDVQANDFAPTHTTAPCTILLHSLTPIFSPVVLVIETGIILLIVDIKNRTFMCFEKRSLIKHGETFVYFTKITGATWCINNIIPVYIALVLVQFKFPAIHRQKKPMQWQDVAHNNFTEKLPPDINLGKEKQKVTSAPFCKKKNVTFPQPGYPSYRIPRPSTLSNSMTLVVEYQYWVHKIKMFFT